MLFSPFVCSSSPLCSHDLPQERIMMLVEAGVDILIIDERNGDTTEQIEQVSQQRFTYMGIEGVAN